MQLPKKRTINIPVGHADPSVLMPSLEHHRGAQPPLWHNLAARPLFKALLELPSSFDRLRASTCARIHVPALWTHPNGCREVSAARAIGRILQPLNALLVADWRSRNSGPDGPAHSCVHSVCWRGSADLLQPANVNTCTRGDIDAYGIDTYRETRTTPTHAENIETRVKH